MALLARYVSGYDVRTAIDPVYFDKQYQVRYDHVVGWVIWYSDGRRFTSLGTGPEQLPKTDAQMMLVYHFREDGKRVDGKLGLLKSVYTREEYPIPGSSVVVRGDWTDWLNHERIFKKAIGEGWPPPGTE